MVIDYHDMVTD